MNIDTEKDTKSNGRWFWPWLLTIVIGVIAVVIAFPQVMNCASNWTSWPSWTERMLIAAKPPSGCMAPNEIGDFLAGVFAPIAFIWLAFAVVLQSRELSAQEKVLRLTKEELKLTREEAERQRSALEEQAKIMAETARLNAEQQARRDLDTLVDMVAPHIIKICNGSPNTGQVSIGLQPSLVMRDHSVHAANAIKVLASRTQIGQELKSADDSAKTLFVDYSRLMMELPSSLSAFDRTLFYDTYKFMNLAVELEIYGSERSIPLPDQNGKRIWE
ncbi:MAG: hypothetical protein K5905_03055 [Roseibium sp.]|uniref:hypothetical protein n=1 Tax=Roseibium sp. TaxID=1936156 RepID=UPI00260AC9CC|nr:hypothetical protein [Roseibium sp.]MCV0424427.1 hypothetical protein [Roseibium sp.]